MKASGVHKKRSPRLRLASILSCGIGAGLLTAWTTVPSAESCRIQIGPSHAVIFPVREAAAGSNSVYARECADFTVLNQSELSTSEVAARVKSDPAFVAVDALSSEFFNVNGIFSQERTAREVRVDGQPVAAYQELGNHVLWLDRRPGEPGERLIVAFEDSIVLYPGARLLNFLTLFGSLLLALFVTSKVGLFRKRTPLEKQNPH